MTAELDPYAGLKERDYFHLMLNPDSFDGFTPTARALAEGYLAAARRRLDGGGLEPELRAFRYSPQAFVARLDEIDRGLVDDVERWWRATSWPPSDR